MVLCLGIGLPAISSYLLLEKLTTLDYSVCQLLRHMGRSDLPVFKLYVGQHTETIDPT